MKFRITKLSTPFGSIMAASSDDDAAAPDDDEFSIDQELDVYDPEVDDDSDDWIHEFDNEYIDNPGEDVEDDSDAGAGEESPDRDPDITWSRDWRDYLTADNDGLGVTTQAEKSWSPVFDEDEEDSEEDEDEMEDTEEIEENEEED